MDKITYLKLIHFMKYQTIAPPRSWWRRIVNSGHFLHATFAGTRLTWIPWGESPVCSCTAARWPRRRPQTGSWTSRIWKEGRKEVTLGQTDQCRACRRTNQGGGGGIIDQLYVLSVPMLPSSATTNFSSLLTHMTIWHVWPRSIWRPLRSH